MHDLTDAQTKAFEQNQADFAELKKQMRSFAETANSRLTASGLAHGPGLHPNRCFLCSCTEFHGLPDDRCTTLHCGHEMTSHDGYQ
ncbi:hypothetical protein [Streptomyces chartreusis]